MKKLLFVFLVAIIAFASFNNYNVAKADQGLSTKSKSAILMDAETKTVVYSSCENDRRPIASMTKIMLLNLCFENVKNGNLNLDEQITVSNTASSMGGSQVFLEANGKYKTSDLIKSVIIASANDASVALAERLYGSEANCVEEMNKKCAEWHLNDTLFSNCTGLPKPTQYSSASDVAVMLCNLIKHEEYFKYSNIWMDEIEHSQGRVTGLTNTNKLVKFYDGCDGGKTGYTSESGFCLAATAKKGSLRFVSVVINAPDSKTRFSDVSNMFNYGFDNFASKMVVDSSKPIDLDIKINKSKCGEIKVAPIADVYVFGKRNQKENVSIDFEQLTEKAPLKKGDIVGRLKVFKDNVEYQCVDVICLHDVNEKTYFDYILDVSNNWSFV